jgi:ribonuclease HI
MRMTARANETIQIFTDGACLGNPGPGGWAALLRYRGSERMLCGGEAQTTNNRMELMAAIAGLEALKRASRVELTTDSQYVKQGIEAWLPRWLANGWRTSARQPVKNQDLWQRLATAAAPHRIAWHWTRGHSGHPENDRVDAEACAAARRLAAMPHN